MARVLTAEPGIDRVIGVDLHGTWPQRPTPMQEKAISMRTRMKSQNLPDWWNQFWRQLETKADQWINGWSREADGPNLFTVLGNTIDIVSAQRTRTILASRQPDLLIQPQVGNIGHMEFHRADEAIEAGALPIPSDTHGRSVPRRGLRPAAPEHVETGEKADGGSMEKPV